eukprot:9581436-Alexandrium_andersonii.AAC.1
MAPLTKAFAQDEATSRRDSSETKFTAPRRRGEEGRPDEVARATVVADGDVPPVPPELRERVVPAALQLHSGEGGLNCDQGLHCAPDGFEVSGTCTLKHRRYNPERPKRTRSPCILTPRRNRTCPEVVSSRTRVCSRGPLADAPSGEGARAGAVSSQSWRQSPKVLELRRDCHSQSSKGNRTETIWIKVRRGFLRNR